MVRSLLLLWVVLCSSIGLYAQQVLQGAEAEAAVQGAEVVRYVDRSSVPAYIKLRDPRQVPAANAMRWLRHALKLGAEDGLVLVESFEDQAGYRHERYQQTYMGRNVMVGMYLMHYKDGYLVSANGEFYAGLQGGAGASLGLSDALGRALQYVGASAYRWEDAREEALLQAETGNVTASWYPTGELVMAPVGGQLGSGNYRLAYRFDVYATAPLSRDYVYVDAGTGAVIWTQNRIHTADVLGSAVTRYSGTQPMTADYTGATYRLRESGRGNGIQTYDMNNGTNYGAAVDFTDANNVWNNVNAQQDEVATDAHWGAEMTYDFFMSSFGRNSIDGNGFMLRSYVHYDNNYNNAFWDGQRMTYGDGNGTNYTPLTAIDVAGHEIAHGLTTFSANLVYQNQSGALNESFSDIFGAAIEHYARPSQWSWRIGEDMTPNGQGIRNMANPGQFGDPDTYQGNNWYTGTNDNGGVHTNSGVQNKWYYILTVGETGTNDLGNAYNVAAQGWTKSSAIAFRNLTVYLTSGSTYADARFYAIQSATDLYGPCSPEVIATTNAWYAVGVGPAFTFSINANFTGTPISSCSAPATVSFSNVSVNGGSYLWHFGDGTTSTALNPTHTYTNLGTYTVTLIAYGGPCGNDTLVRTAYIDVDTANACSVTLTPGGPNSTQTACSGTLYDSGGPSANYGANTSTTITIAPTGASSVSLTFSSFNFEAGYDYVYIYNGPSTNSPLIGAYTGNTLPNGGTVTANSGVMTIRQFTDPAVEESGFAANWSCALPTAPPSVNFVGNNLNSCNGIVQFTDMTTGGPTAWLWNFGDATSSTQQHPLHQYQANGTYTVTLTATNLVGQNTFTRTAYVTVNKPAGPSATGATRCGPGVLTLNSTGANPKSWYDAPTGGNLVGSGNSFVTPYLTNSGVYYVQQETPAALQRFGPLTPAAVGGGGYHNNTSVQYMTFTVSAPLTLVSVYVDPGAAGNRTIQLWDGTGNFIQDVTLNIGQNPQRINLNWTLQPGSYRIGGSQMDLYRNNNVNPAYPYQLAGLASITGSSAGANFFYYFYDWEVRGQNCVSQRTPVPATIEALPTPVISPANPQFCPGGSVVLSANGGVSYQWSTGSSASSITVNQAGNYYVIATNTAGCSDTSAVVTTSAFQPQASITPNGPTTLCPGGSVTLTASAGSNYQWSTGATGASVTVSNSGTYTVTLNDPNGCTATASQVVQVSNAPTVTITSSGGLGICPGGQVTLNAPQGVSYAWSNGATSQSVSVTQPGTYNVTVNFSGGCVGSGTPVTVTQLSAPTAAILASNGFSFCSGLSTVLNASGGVSYAWSNGPSTAAQTVSTAGSYTVTVTDASGCTDTETVQVSVLALPNAVISGPTAVCDGEDAQLVASGGGTYAWSTGSSSSTISVINSGTYVVTVTGSNGCTNTASSTLTVNPAPTANFSSVSNQGDVNFTDLSTGASNWVWYFGDGNTSTAQNPLHTYTASGTYTVTLTVTNAFGCTDVFTTTVTVLIVGMSDPNAGLWVNGIYPNPFQGSLKFDLNLPHAGHLKITALDMTGRMVAGVLDTEVSGGIYVHEWRPEGVLPQGTYFMRMAYEGQVVMHKVVHIE